MENFDGNNQHQSVDQNQRVEGQHGGESILQSSGSSSVVYEPNQQDQAKQLSKAKQEVEKSSGLRRLVVEKDESLQAKVWQPDDSDDTQSGTPLVAAEAQRTNQIQSSGAADQIGVNSVLESFANESGSKSYVPSDMVSGQDLLESAIQRTSKTLQAPDGQSASLNSLVSLLREQIAQNKNKNSTKANPRKLPFR